MSHVLVNYRHYRGALPPLEAAWTDAPGLL